MSLNGIKFKDIKGMLFGKDRIRYKNFRKSFYDEGGVVDSVCEKMKIKSKLTRKLVRQVVGPLKQISIQEYEVYVYKISLFDNFPILGIDTRNNHLEIFDSKFEWRGYLNSLYRDRFGINLT